MAEMVPPTVVDSTVRLRGALVRMGDALATAQLDGLLGAEAELADALGQLSVSGRPSPPDLHALTVELGRTRAALVRCRRLGTALVEVARLVGQARGAGSSYGSDGRERGAGPGPALEARA